MPENTDFWAIGGEKLSSRLFIGSAGYPSPAILAEAVRASEAEVITVSLRRENAQERAGQKFWEHIRGLNIHILPNTAGCKTAAEAITTAQMAREVFGTDWIKLEVIADDDTLRPDVFGTAEAACELNKQGFTVFPYMTEDLSLTEQLLKEGCSILMPWGSPIGSGQGVRHAEAISLMRAKFPEANILIDAGLGTPSHGAQAMELGCDGILLNTAIAKAVDPVGMARGFKHSVIAGRAGYLSGAIEPINMARPSTPVVGTPFWHEK